MTAYGKEEEKSVIRERNVNVIREHTDAREKLGG
jgi:hypothetical protein